MTLTPPQIAATIIREHCEKGFTPKLGLILGSGLGSIADQIDDAITIPYQNIPGFPHTRVSGHKGQLVLGHLGGLPVACLQGRVHRYEGAQNETIKCLIRTLKVLGCDTLLITNAAGSLRSEIAAGSLALIDDHINLSFDNPLVGPNDDEYGERFHAMEDAYHPLLRQKMMAIAKTLNITLSSGVYIGVLGPSFETPAEINAFRVLGADLVGMSTIPEVIIARHCGLRVIALSAVTNLAAGMSKEHLSHAGTLQFAAIAAQNAEKLIFEFARSLHHEKF